MERNRSSVLIELMEHDPRLAGQIYKRCTQEAEGNDEKRHNPPLMLEAENGAHECDHHMQRREKTRILL